MKGHFGRFTLSESDRQVLATWAADCAERVLPLFVKIAPFDTRPRDAIAGARAFARGEFRIGIVRALSANAHAAAREVGDAAATAAARAAGHAAGVAHMAAHSRGAAYAVIAAGLADHANPYAMKEEAQWQLEHASSLVRDIMLRLPPPKRTRGALSIVICDMHEQFTLQANRTASNQ